MYFVNTHFIILTEATGHEARVRLPATWESLAVCSSIKVSSFAAAVIRFMSRQAAFTAMASPPRQTGQGGEDASRTDEDPNRAQPEDLTMKPKGPMTTG